MHAKTHTSIRNEAGDIILLHAMDSVPTNMMATQFYGNNCTLPTATGSSELPVTTKCEGFLSWAAKGNVNDVSSSRLHNCAGGMSIEYTVTIVTMCQVSYDFRRSCKW